MTYHFPYIARAYDLLRAQAKTLGDKQGSTPNRLNTVSCPAVVKSRGTRPANKIPGFYDVYVHCLPEQSAFLPLYRGTQGLKARGGTQ